MMHAVEWVSSLIELFRYGGLRNQVGKLCECADAALQEVRGPWAKLSYIHNVISNMYILQQQQCHFLVVMNLGVPVHRDFCVPGLHGGAFMWP